MNEKDASEKLEKQYKRQNEWNKNNYDRISCTLPKGTKEKIIATGESVNSFINRLVIQELEKNNINECPF